MRCPNCSAKLHMALRNGYLGYWCNDCFGVYVPRIFAPHFSSAIGVNRAKLWHSILSNAQHQSDIACPVCCKLMSKATINHFNLNGCAGCLALWLDDLSSLRHSCMQSSTITASIPGCQSGLIDV